MRCVNIWLTTILRISIISMKSITFHTRGVCMEKNKVEKNKYVGVCKVGEKGQIVIPKEIRNMFDISPGDSVIVLCDKEKGIALLKADIIDGLTDKILKQ